MAQRHFEHVRCGTPLMRTEHRQRSRANFVVALIAVVILGCALLLLRNLARVDFDQAIHSLTSIPLSRVIVIGMFVAGSYACLTFFDWLGLKYVGHPLPYRQAALASFTALSLGHNIGFAALSSGAVRYRFYSRWGLGAVEIGKLILFCGVTVGLGLVTLGGIALVVMPRLSGEVIGAGGGAARVLGCICLSVPVAYVGAALGEVRLKVHRWSLELPSTSLALAQVLLGTLNFALVAACLHQALSAFSEVSYPAVVAVYVLANSAAIASHVPGGLGVIESAVLFLLPGAASFAAVIAFRIAYFLIPLPIGLSALLISELVFANRPRMKKAPFVTRNESVG
jgi:uncharacterized membrane protein YbhN (UPF0104 family)